MPLCCAVIRSRHARLTCPSRCLTAASAPRLWWRVDVAGIQPFGERNTTFRNTPSAVNLCIDHRSNSGYAYETLVDAGPPQLPEPLTTLISRWARRSRRKLPPARIRVYNDTGRFRLSNDGGDPPGGGSGSDRGRSRRGKAERAPVREPLPRARVIAERMVRKPELLR